MAERQLRQPVELLAPVAYGGSSPSALTGCAGVVEMGDTLVLETSAFGRGGSSPLTGTKFGERGRRQASALLTRQPPKNGTGFDSQALHHFYGRCR
jgi:hypothetical protein